MDNLKSEAGSRIFFARKSLRLTQKDFAAGIGISPSTLSEIEARKSAVQEYHLIAIELRYGISREWVEFGRGEMRVNKVREPELCPSILLFGEWADKPEVRLEDYYAAPLLDGSIAAGLGLAGLVFDRENVRSFVWIYAPELRDRRSHKLLAVEVDQKSGDSMRPTLEPGDIVLVDHDDPAGSTDLFFGGKIYAISDEDGGCSIKRVYKAKKGFIIGSDNRSVAPEPAWTTNISELIIGRVVWGWRNLLDV
ncbi:MAG: S24 family peptidase [Syntrophobacteraceae bacterium]